MKLKRILSGVLVFILIISLCACSTKKKKYENRLNLLTAETQENNIIKTQKYYENYFTSEDLNVNGDSVNLMVGNFSMERLLASDKSKKLSFSKNNNVSEFYETIDGEQYAHIVAPDEETGKMTDNWYHYLSSENEEADRDEDYDIFENDFSLGLDEFNIEAKNIEDVKYLRTEKGIDYLTVSVRRVENGNKSTNDCEVGVDAKTHKIIFVSGKFPVVSLDEDMNSNKNLKIKMVITFSDVDSIKMNIPKKVKKCDIDASFVKYVVDVIQTTKNTVNAI